MTPIPESELRIETWRQGRNCGMQVIHIATGLVVSGTTEASLTGLRRDLMHQLAERVANASNKKQLLTEYKETRIDPKVLREWIKEFTGNPRADFYAENAMSGDSCLYDEYHVEEPWDGWEKFDKRWAEQTKKRPQEPNLQSQDVSVADILVFMARNKLMGIEFGQTYALYFSW